MSKKTSGRNATAKQNEYISKAYDRITLLVPKGDKEKIKDANYLNPQTISATADRIMQAYGI